MQYIEEINFDEALELVRSDATVYAFVNNIGELEFLKEMLNSKDVLSIDLDEAREIVMCSIEGTLPSIDVKKYEHSIVVCPHGKTSLKFIRSLSVFNITAHSLKEGTEGLRMR